MKRLYKDIGLEHDLAQTSRTLRTVVRAFSPNGVGAMHITCADETEHEVAAAFQQVFTQGLLPRLKYGSHVPLRLANAGGRYEWGTVGIAEAHFATPETHAGFKVLVVKVNGHVAATKSGAGIQFGTLERYGAASTACGAVDALLHGSDLPFATDLRADLLSGGQDRLATLLDPARVDPALRPLVGALVLARLQARWVALDIQDHVSRSPTIYLILHGVTLNRPGPDGEILGGVYSLDRRTSKPHDRYCGLGDDPSLYEVRIEGGHVHVSDPQSGAERAARDHRALAAQRLPEVASAAFKTQLAPLVAAKRAGRKIDKGLLMAALASLASVDPLPVAVLLLARGVAGIHHARALDQAVDKKEQAAKARGVIAAVREQVKQLSPADAAQVAAALL